VQCLEKLWHLCEPSSDNLYLLLAAAGSNGRHHGHPWRQAVWSGTCVECNAKGK